MRNKPIAIRKVKFPDGTVDRLGEPERKRVFPDGVAYEVTQILEDNIDSGTGTAAATGCGDEAGKTGTTDDFNDAMFVGYTPVLSTGVWVGYPDALQSMYSVHGISVAGGTFPAMIWNDFMEVAVADGCGSFSEPENPVEWIDFNGEYSSSSGGSYSSDYDYDYGQDDYYDDGGGTEDDTSQEEGAYAPGLGQKPAPKPSPAPPPAQPPGGGVTP